MKKLSIDVIFQWDIKIKNNFLNTNSYGKIIHPKIKNLFVVGTSNFPDLFKFSWLTVLANGLRIGDYLKMINKVKNFFKSKSRFYFNINYLDCFLIVDLLFLINPKIWKKSIAILIIST